MKKNSLIKLAPSSHSSCFICRRKSQHTRLRKVKKESVAYAYLNHKIIIKSHARSCFTHLNNIGEIKKEEFLKIRTKTKIVRVNRFLWLDFFSNYQRPLFDYFKNIDALDEKICIEITGWTKQEFIRFSNLITSINDTKGRTKEQLIALYRYWLRKGVDQTTLAHLFSKKAKQCQISRYLDQIRKAIYKDFVPFYIGSKKDRNFFSQHNNSSVMELHNLKKMIWLFLWMELIVELKRVQTINFNIQVGANRKWICF